MRNRQRWIHIALVVILFLVAFIPRAVDPVSRPPQWYERSLYFVDAVIEGTWEDITYTEHPGVTTMWLSGTALRLAGVAPVHRSDGPHVDREFHRLRESAIGVLPLALAISLMIVVVYGLLLQLLGRTEAFVGALLVALDPFFLANSKVLHVDGLLTALMIGSALALLVYLQKRGATWIVLSGALGALALLSKSVALFLIPYTGLCLGLGVLFAPEIDWRRGVTAGISWLAVACVVYCALFPGMWSDPVGTLRTVYSEAWIRVDLAHPNPLFFMGQVVTKDPGPLYYLVVWGSKLTAPVFVFALIALAYTLLDRSRPARERATLGLLFAYAGFFTLQMVIGAKKMPRYLLPAFPAIAIVAGDGMVRWSRRVVSLLAQRRVTLPTLLTSLLVLQAALVLPRHPYYDTYFNDLVGARTGVWALSTQWQGEGMDIAARLLNRLPGVETMRAGSKMSTFTRQYFAGQVVKLTDEAEWYIFGTNDAMRYEGKRGGEPWDFYRRRAPWATVSFGSLPYAWMFTQAQGPQSPAEIDFGPGIKLAGFDIAPPPYHPGGTVRLQLYWEAATQPEEDFTVFVHLFDGDGNLVTQQDSFPVHGTHPTSGWRSGETVIDPYDLVLPDSIPPGEISIAVGLYRWTTGERLPAYAPTGDRLPDDRFGLGVVTTTPATREPGTWAARVLAVIFLGAALVLDRKAGRRS